MHREWSLGPRHAVMVLVPVALLLILGLVFWLTFLGSSGPAAGSPTTALSAILPSTSATPSPTAATSTETPTPAPSTPTPTPTPTPVLKNLGVAKGALTLDGPASAGAGGYVLFVVDGAKDIDVKDSTKPYALHLDTRTLPNGKYTIKVYTVLPGAKTLISTNTLQIRNPKPKPKPKPVTKPKPKPKPGTPSSTGTSLAAQEVKVIALTNADRAKAGCGPVSQSAALTRAAVKHAGFELKNQAEGHLFPGEQDLGTRDTAAGYTGWTSLGENAAGAPGGAWWVDADAVMHGGKATKVVNGVSTTFTSLGWMQDAGHKANILNCAFKDIGVGAVQDSSGAIWWSQDFGTRS